MSPAHDQPGKRRGRPRAFAPEHELTFRNLFPEISTHRGIQNRMYAVRAMQALRDQPDAHERFAWLLGPSGDAPKLRFTVLTELGRLGSLAEVVSFATVLCEKKLRPRVAVALLRQRVRGKGTKQPTLAATVDHLRAAVDAWFDQYLDADTGVLLEAINQVYCDLQDSLERERS